MIIFRDHRDNLGSCPYLKIPNLYTSAKTLSYKVTFHRIQGLGPDIFGTTIWPNRMPSSTHSLIGETPMQMSNYNIIDYIL